MSSDPNVESPFNPLDKKNLGISVADALLGRPVEQLPPSPSFNGAGIYAIYYLGDFPPYEKLSALNRDDRFCRPIYVGKAVPAGARKGGFGLDLPAGPVLYKRLAEHADSIRDAVNLKACDFFCRYLLVDDIWIPLGESLLIEMFAPVWNKVVDGFGNHDPGSGRHNQQVSSWDILHPGRPWAVRLRPAKKTASELMAAVTTFLEASVFEDKQHP
jgi:hypothetical protein